MTPPDDPPDEPDWVKKERAEFEAANPRWWADTIDPAVVDLVPGPPIANGNGHHPTPDEGEELTDRQELEAVLMRGRTILDIEPPEPLIDGWLNRDSFAVLYGRPKGGKSFVALDMALCISTDTPWHGHAVSHGPVLYVVAEGVRGVGPRVHAWGELNSVEITDDVWWLPRPVNLLALRWAAALTDVAREIQPALIVIDTLNRSMAGGEENSSKDMGMVIDACTRLRHATSACIMLVHHSGKNTENGARGHSSLLGAVDTELELRSADGLIELNNTAQKDAAAADTLHLGLTPAAGSVAITQRAHRDGANDVSPSAEKALEILTSIQAPGGISTTTWLRSCEMVERTFYNARKQLHEAHLVTNLGTTKSPRYVVKGMQYDLQSETPPEQRSL